VECLNDASNFPIRSANITQLQGRLGRAAMSDPMPPSVAVTKKRRARTGCLKCRVRRRKCGYSLKRTWFEPGCDGWLIRRSMQATRGSRNVNDVFLAATNVNMGRGCRSWTRMRSPSWVHIQPMGKAMALLWRSLRRRAASRFDMMTRIIDLLIQ
jgi:hypothetical protein